MDTSFCVCINMRYPCAPLTTAMECVSSLTSDLCGGVADVTAWHQELETHRQLSQLPERSSCIKLCVQQEVDTTKVASVTTRLINAPKYWAINRVWKTKINSVFCISWCSSPSVTPHCDITTTLLLLSGSCLPCIFYPSRLPHQKGHSLLNYSPQHYCATVTPRQL